MVERTLRGTDFFRDGRRIFVNRIEESFQSWYHAHDFIEITYVSEGKGYHHIGEQVVPVSKGELFVLPIGVPHVFRPYSASPGQKLVVYNCLFPEAAIEQLGEHIEDIDLRSLLRPKQEPYETVNSVIDRELALEPLFQSMFNEYTARRPGSSAVLFALLLQLLVQLSRKAIRPPESADFEESDPIGQAVEYVSRHAEEELTVRSMAERCRMSERHFFRLFKQRTGQPFHEYVQHARIRTSCELLQCTRHKISAVAETVGYRDTQSFCRVFKRIVGITPGAYRKQRKQVLQTNRT
ncbi:AraC family transcriptional regulator [Paenibacillus contaminans]|uniref:AraC family transcriptional regulator n=1 Tax=Paenibacillus contaminans TaxID=450362 RepID=A0A329MM92_9BACL|nr:AraC family transcriptional regulator [Paenibacillus contaminans]